MDILMQTTVREFYKQRAGFFMVVILCGFGFMTPREHFGIAVFFLTSSPLNFGAFSTLYVGLVWFFWNHLWKSRAYSFIYLLRLLPLRTRLVELICIAVGLLLPLILYFIWIFFVAAQLSLWNSLLTRSVFLLLWTGTLVAAGNYRLTHPNTSYTKRTVRSFLKRKRPVSMPLWTIEWLFRERGLTLLLTKLGSSLTIAATLWYYSTDEFDLRLPAVGLSFAALANLGISYETYRWRVEAWSWSRTLPLKRRQRVLDIVFTHFLLLIPELFVITRYGLSELEVVDLIQLFFFIWSILISYHGLLSFFNLPFENSLKRLFFPYIVLTILIMYQIPLYFLTIILFSIGLRYIYAGVR